MTKNEKAALATTSATSPNALVDGLRQAQPTTPRGDLARPDLEIPTAAEVFDKPYPPPRVETPEAWTDPDSIAVELADRECARLIVNALHDPPITDVEIERRARQHRLSFEAAEIELRRERDA